MTNQIKNNIESTILDQLNLNNGEISVISFAKFQNQNKISMVISMNDNGL